MNKKTYKVVKGYSDLSDSEKKEVRDAIENLDSKTFSFEQRDIIKSLSESVGPLDSDNCPCCGRS